MKVLFVVFLLCAQAFAAEELVLYFGCEGNDCQEMKEDEYRTQKLEKTPAMIIRKSDIESARFQKDEISRDVLVVQLSEGKGKEFAEVTGKYFERVLAITSNGKVLMAPVIRGRITGGAFQLSAGMDKENKYLKEIPWLKEMAEAETIKETSKQNISFAIYIVVGILALGGLIYLVFIRTRKKK